jgi:hypothetical protein
MCAQYDAPASEVAAMKGSVQPQKEPRLDAGNMDHDHCA